jgi:membrane protease YdiL (CAAX protease family)
VPNDYSSSENSRSPDEKPWLPRLVQLVFWDAESDRIRAGWRILLTFVVFFAIYIAARQLLQALPLPDLLSTRGAPALFFVAIGVALFLAARFLDKRPIRDYGLAFNRTWWIDFASGAVMGILFHAGVTAAHYGLGWAEVTEVASTGAFEVPLAAALALVFLQFAAIGTWEEVLFRGVFILNTTEGFSGWNASRTTRVVGAWLASTVVFGLLHVSSAGGEGVPIHAVVLQATVAGVYFGLPYLWTGRLALPIGLHITTNFASVALFGGTAPRFADFPALVRFETDFPGMWADFLGLGVVGQIVMVGVIAAWVYASRGELSIAPSLLEAATPQRSPSAARPD